MFDEEFLFISGKKSRLKLNQTFLRLYFLVLLKRADVPARDIISFYNTCIRPVLEYCAPVFHHALPGYLCDDLERIQKRALSIISPGLSYTDNFTVHDISTLKDRRQKLCKKLFQTVVSDADHKLYHLLPPLIGNIDFWRRWNAIASGSLAAAAIMKYDTIQ